MARLGEKIKPFQLPITKEFAVGDDETHLLTYPETSEVVTFKRRHEAKVFCCGYNICLERLNART